MKGKQGGGGSGRPAGRPPVATPPSASRSPELRVTELALWLLVLVPPFVVVPSAQESFRLPKLMVAEWLALASLLSLAVALALARRRPLSAPLRPAALLRSLPLRAAAPLVAVALCGLAVTRHPFHLREGLADLAIGAACLVGWSLPGPWGLGVERLLRLRRLLDGLLWPAAALALLGILQFHGLYQPLRFLGLAAGSRLAVTSLAGNPGDLAAFLVLPALLAQQRLAGSRPGLGRWATAAALALSVYALAATQTLAALAALALGSAVFWAMRLPFRWRRAAAAALGGAAVVALVLVAALPPLRTRVALKAQQMRSGDWNAALSGRLDGWRAAAFLLAEHPLAGVGQGAFRAEFAPAKLALLARGVAFYPDQPNASFANAHNELLEVGADLGWPGLAALAWGIGMLLAALRRLGSGGGGRAVPAALAWAGVAALAVLALAQFPFRVALVAFPALLFLAWVFAAAAEIGAAESTSEAAAETAGAAGASAGLAWALAAVLAAGLVGQTLRADGRLAASRLLATVEALSIAAASAGRAPDGLLSANLAALDRAARLDPVEVEIPVARGSQFLLFGRAEAALGPYRRALALEPHAEIYLDLSRAYLAAGDAEQARANLDLALRLSPWLRSQISWPAAPAGLAP